MPEEILIALIGLAGVMIGGLLNFVTQLAFEWKSRKREATYLAIRLVSILDGFVRQCGDVADDDGTWHGQPPSDGLHRPQQEVPSLNFDELDVNWKVLPNSILYEVLNLPNLLEISKLHIDAAFEYGDPPEYAEAFDQRRYRYASLGTSTNNTAETLRNHYGLPARAKDDWDPVEHLRNRENELAEKIAARREMHEESMRKYLQETGKDGA